MKGHKFSNNNTDKIIKKNLLDSSNRNTDSTIIKNTIPTINNILQDSFVIKKVDKYRVEFYYITTILIYPFINYIRYIIA